MSASQHTIAHARKSTSEIHPNGVSCPDHNQHQHHRYENIVLDLLQSDILSVLPAHLKAVLLLGAGLANSDNRDDRYRSFYFRQRWTAERIWASRARRFPAISEPSLSMASSSNWAKAIRKTGARATSPSSSTPSPNSRTSAVSPPPKPGTTLPAKRPPQMSPALWITPQRVSTTALQPPTERVSTERDTLLSSGRDTLTERMSTGRDTKRDLLLKIEKRNGKGVHPSNNGDNIKTDINTNVNDHSAADVSDGQSDILCPCGNAIPAEKWAAGREVCKECWEKDQRAAHAERKKEEEKNKRKHEEGYRESFREKWAHLDKGKRADTLWIGANFATRGTAASLGAAAD